MMYPVPREETVIVGPSRPCVKNGNAEVIDYLMKTIGTENMFFCRPGLTCQFVCPKEFFPFEVFEPLEIFEDSNGFIKMVIDQGIYQIVQHDHGDASHFLVLEKYEDEKWKKFGGFNGGWMDGAMIDWRGIRSVKGTDI